MHFVGSLHGIRYHFEVLEEKHILFFFTFGVNISGGYWARGFVFGMLHNLENDWASFVYL